MSSVELARQSGVSQASVARFAVAMGFDGYQHLQTALRQTVGILRSESAGEEADNKFQRALLEEQAGLERLRNDAAFDESVRRLGRVLAESDGFLTIGLRHAAGVATYFGYLAAKVHTNVRTITDGGSAVLERLLFGKRDGCEWLVCFALPRYPVELREIMEFARSIGLKVAMVSVGHPLQLVEFADMVISVKPGNGLTFDCPISSTMAAGLILESLCDVRPREVQQQLDAEDQLAIAAGVFFPE